MMGDGVISSTSSSKNLATLLPAGDRNPRECERVMQIAAEAIENLQRGQLPDPLVQDGGCEQQALLVAECAERLLADLPAAPRDLDEPLSDDLFVLIQAQFLYQARGEKGRLDLSRLEFQSKKRADRANFAARKSFSQLAASRYGLEPIARRAGLDRFDVRRALDVLLARGRIFGLAKGAEVRFYSGPRFDPMGRPKGVIIKIEIDGEFPLEAVPDVLRRATADEVRASQEGEPDPAAYAIERNGCVIKHCVAAMGETA